VAILESHSYTFTIQVGGIRVPKSVLIVGSLLIAAVVVAFLFRPGASSTEAPGTASTKIEPKWTYDTHEQIAGALALADNGTIYAAGQISNVYALNPDGTLLWKFRSGPVQDSPVIGPDGAIYVTTTTGSVFAINSNGTQRWQGSIDTVVNYNQSGGAIDRTSYYTAGRHGLIAVSLDSGEKRWETVIPFGQYGSPAILQNGLILYPGHGRLNTIDTAGDPQWSYPAVTAEAIERNGGWPPPGDGSFDSGIALGPDGTIYGAAGNARFVAVGQDQKLKWEFKTHWGNKAAPVVAVDGTVYCGGGDGILYAFDPMGNKKWELTMQGALDASPVLAEDGTIYAVATEFAAISPDGKKLWSFRTNSAVTSSPTIAPDGTVYFATYPGVIMAVPGTGGGLMPSSWPKFQHDAHNSGSAR
jgi:outer membrane protein assembly factor BamB